MMPSRAKKRAAKKSPIQPLVGLIMGSSSDWDTIIHAADILDSFDIAYEARVVSAHRTPKLMAKYANEAERRGLQVIIAGAGGAAHLPGMTASHSLLPVIGVPVETKALKGLDSLLSIAQMPSGIPVATVAVGKSGASNAALLAIAILASTRPHLKSKLRKFRLRQTRKVLSEKLKK